MVSRQLVIVEVSQKQAYIFASNKLQTNIINSEAIVKVTGSGYFQKVCPALYAEEKNLVYTGGGHTVLNFESADDANAFSKKLSYAVMRDYPDMEIFIRSMPYDDGKTPGDNLKELTKLLEKKKSIRKSSFHQGSFAIEKISGENGKPERLDDAEKVIPGKDDLLPAGYDSVTQFGDLGGSREESNFIAVVHIDGNSMGKRVEELYEKLNREGVDWETYKQKIRAFSDGIDSDFKTSYKEMTADVAKGLEDGKLSDLDLKGKCFPVRRIIISGDDVCFVSEGRIGIECSRLLIEHLREKKNAVDGKGYEACAGIAIVHQKYPFYRAYDLAESLCSKAKRFGASIDPEHNGALVSSVDWHISFGELGDSVDEIRREYVTGDGKQLELRPYIIGGDESCISKEKDRRYDNFRKLYALITDKNDGIAHGKIKQLRPVLKQGQTAGENYLRYNRIESIMQRSYVDIFEDIDLDRVGKGEAQNGKLFISTTDGKERCILFDAIEIMDTYLMI